MRIALLYNDPLPSRYDSFGESVAVSSVLESVTAVKEVLQSAGHQVTLHGLQPPLAGAASRVPPTRPRADRGRGRPRPGSDRRAMP